MPDYQFFFSYAPENYENASWKLKEKSGNHLSDFFEAVCKGVSDKTGIPFNQVGYFDRVRLSISDPWEKQLRDGLQNSRVLVAMLSPAYLKSESCGREFQFFIERFKLLKTDISQQPHRIVPVFWVDLYSCLKDMDQNVSKLITELQWRQEGMPKNYPSVGIVQMYRLMEIEMFVKAINCIVQRIVELAGFPPLPSAPPDQFDFKNFPSAWHQMTSPVAYSDTSILLHDKQTNNNQIYEKVGGN